MGEFKVERVWWHKWINNRFIDTAAVQTSSWFKLISIKFNPHSESFNLFYSSGIYFYFKITSHFLLNSLQTFLSSAGSREAHVLQASSSTSSSSSSPPRARSSNFSTSYQSLFLLLGSGVNCCTSSTCVFAAAPGEQRTGHKSSGVERVQQVNTGERRNYQEQSSTGGRGGGRSVSCVCVRVRVCDVTEVFKSVKQLL